MSDRGAIRDFVAATLGLERADAALAVLAIDGAIDAAGSGKTGEISRAQFAMALNVALFADLLARVPTAAAYVAEVETAGECITLDHGALRTIDAEGATGALPSGIAAFARILEPLGYEVAGLYPLPRLRMTGRAFMQRDFPGTIPQFFVSALHVGALAAPAQAAATRVFASSRDPLGETERAALAQFSTGGACESDVAAAALPGIVAAFARQHEVPALADYEALLADSREAAWIATEGNAFNHATTRVPDVVALAERLRAQGKPIKPAVEVSTSGRVRQTAFLADQVERRFLSVDGHTVVRAVPGSFYEFISRDIDPATGEIDLAFDSGNATGIFAMTSGRSA